MPKFNKLGVDRTVIFMFRMTAIEALTAIPPSIGRLKWEIIWHLSKHTPELTAIVAKMRPDVNDRYQSQ